MNLEDLQNNWAIIVGFVAGIGAWGRTASTAASARDSAKKAHERVDEVRDDVAAMKESIGRIETHQEYSRKGIDDIREWMQRQQ